MTKKTRRHMATDKKAELLRQHLADKRPISEICTENDLQPSVFYGWVRQLLANAPAALTNGRPPKTNAREAELQAKIDRLEARLTKKDGVIAELSEELVASKKTLGTTDRHLGASRHAGRDRGLRRPVVGGHGDRGQALRPVAGRSRRGSSSTG